MAPVILVAFCLAFGVSSANRNLPLKHSATAYKQPSKPYSFSYGINDEYAGTNFERSEQSDGNKVVGSYSIQLPDGRTQTVKYIADHHKGFIADVSYSGDAHYPPPKKGNPFVTHQGKQAEVHKPQLPPQELYHKTPPTHTPTSVHHEVPKYSKKHLPKVQRYQAVNPHENFKVPNIGKHVHEYKPEKKLQHLNPPHDITNKFPKHPRNKLISAAYEHPPEHIPSPYLVPNNEHHIQQLNKQRFHIPDHFLGFDGEGQNLGFELQEQNLELEGHGPNSEFGLRGQPPSGFESSDLGFGPQEQKPGFKGPGQSLGFGPQEQNLGFDTQGQYFGFGLEEDHLKSENIFFADKAKDDLTKFAQHDPFIGGPPISHIIHQEKQPFANDQEGPPIPNEEDYDSFLQTNPNSLPDPVFYSDIRKPQIPDKGKEFKPIYKQEPLGNNELLRHLNRRPETAEPLPPEDEANFYATHEPNKQTKRRLNKSRIRPNFFNRRIRPEYVKANNAPLKSPSSFKPSSAGELIRITRESITEDHKELPEDVSTHQDISDDTQKENINSDSNPIQPRTKIRKNYAYRRPVAATHRTQNERQAQAREAEGQTLEKHASRILSNEEAPEFRSTEVNAMPEEEEAQAINLDNDERTEGRGKEDTETTSSDSKRILSEVETPALQQSDTLDTTNE